VATPTHQIKKIMIFINPACSTGGPVMTAKQTPGCALGCNTYMCKRKFFYNETSQI